MFNVYIHTNRINKKKYVGITSLSLSQRWRGQGKGYKNQHYFWSAIQKYGWDNFDHEVVFTTSSKEDACQKEQDLISYYKTNIPKNGYNLTSGGEHYCHNEDFIKMMKENTIGDKNPFYGKSHTEETKALMS